MSTYVEEQIADRRRQLADIDRRRLVLEAELRTLEDVQRHMGQRAETASGNGAAAPVSEAVASFERMSEEWKKVVRTLASRQTFRAHDMQEVGTSQGMEITVPNVRSQLTILTQKGVLRRVAEGIYAVSEEIAGAAG